MDPLPGPEPDRVPARTRMGRRGTLIGGALALLLLAGVAALAWHLTHGEGGQAAQRNGPGRRGAPPTTVGVASAERIDIPVTMEALGTVTPAATVTVRPQVSGILKQVLYREGQTVKAGQVLAQVDPVPFQNALMQATGQRQRDEAQLENARLTLERYRTLLAQDSIARQDVDTQAALVKQLEGTVTADRAAEATANLNLANTRIEAPIDGRVGLRVVDVGNLVSSSDVNGIAVITRLVPIDVEFAVPQDRVQDIQARVNAGAKLPVDALDRTRSTVLDTGTFSTLDNQVDQQTGTVRAKARFGNARNTLFPSQFVNVRLLLRTIPNAVVVPVTALRHGGDGDYVFVLNEAERTVAMRKVTAGQIANDKVAIAQGLQGGEKVITEGADRLRDGSRVALPGAANDANRGGRNGGAERRRAAPATTP